MTPPSLASGVDSHWRQKTGGPKSSTRGIARGGGEGGGNGAGMIKLPLPHFTPRCYLRLEDAFFGWLPIDMGARKVAACSYLFVHKRC